MASTYNTHNMVFSYEMHAPAAEKNLCMNSFGIDTAIINMLPSRAKPTFLPYFLKEVLPFSQMHRSMQSVGRNVKLASVMHKNVQGTKKYYAYSMHFIDEKL